MGLRPSIPERDAVIHPLPLIGSYRHKFMTLGHPQSFFIHAEGDTFGVVHDFFSTNRPIILPCTFDSWGKWDSRLYMVFESRRKSFFLWVLLSFLFFRWTTATHFWDHRCARKLCTPHARLGYGCSAKLWKSLGLLIGIVTSLLLRDCQGSWHEVSPGRYHSVWKVLHYMPPKPCLTAQLLR